jgi:hypothetical protein
MTDLIRIAHAAGIRKDRLSSRGHKRRRAWSEATRGDRKAASFFVPLIPNFASLWSTPFANFAIRPVASH